MKMSLEVVDEVINKVFNEPKLRLLSLKVLLFATLSALIGLPAASIDTVSINLRRKTMLNNTLDQLVEQVTQDIKEGDLIFISINSPLYRQVAKGTGSWTSHVGFIVKEAGEWCVLESAVPTVKRCSLKKFLARTRNNEVAIRRLNEDLTDEQIMALKETAAKRMGRFYHLGFNFDSSRQFCSKFVYLTFKEALGIELGKVQTMKQLLEENPQASVNFWRCWYFGFIPWQRRTITPASQLYDTQLKDVYSTVAYTNAYAAA